MAKINVPIPDLDRLEGAASKLEQISAPMLAAQIRAAIAEIRERRAVAPPAWTRERPTVPGWYWVRGELAQATGGPGDPLYVTLEGRWANPLDLTAGRSWPLQNGWEYYPIPLPPMGEPKAEGES